MLGSIGKHSVESVESVLEEKKKKVTAFNLMKKQKLSRFCFGLSKFKLSKLYLESEIQFHSIGLTFSLQTVKKRWIGINTFGTFWKMYNLAKFYSVLLVVFV